MEARVVELALIDGLPNNVPQIVDSKGFAASALAAAGGRNVAEVVQRIVGLDLATRNNVDGERATSILVEIVSADGVGRRCSFIDRRTILFHSDRESAQGRRTNVPSELLYLAVVLQAL